MQMRQLVGKVLAANMESESPGPYIPLFYQLADKIDLPNYEAAQVKHQF